jgi:hypothetical protein
MGNHIRNKIKIGRSIMATRKKIYYQENDIVRSLYTNGFVLMLLETMESYVGYYHYYESTGEIFTEQDWHPTKSRELIPYVGGKTSSYYKYVDLVHYTKIKGEKKRLIGPPRLDKFKSPQNTVIMPTEKEIQTGVMTRYFVMKRNEKTTKVPIEIDVMQAERYTSGARGINQFLYELLELPWKLTGPEYDIISGGILKEPGVYDTNKRIVEKHSRKFPILKKVLTNLREFSIYNT